MTPEEIVKALRDADVALEAHNQTLRSISLTLAPANKQASLEVMQASYDVAQAQLHASRAVLTVLEGGG